VSQEQNTIEGRKSCGKYSRVGVDLTQATMARVDDVINELT